MKNNQFFIFGLIKKKLNYIKLYLLCPARVQAVAQQKLVLHDHATLLHIMELFSTVVVKYSILSILILF